MKINSAQWIVLDNAKHRWPLTTNLSKEMAMEAITLCVENGWLLDGKITPEGEGTLLSNPYPSDYRKQA